MTPHAVHDQRYLALGSYVPERVRLLVKHAVNRHFAYTASDYIDNVGGVALAIRGADGTPCAALSIASGMTNMSLTRARELLPKLQSAVRTIEQRIGAVT